MVGTKIFYKRKLRRDGEIEKHKKCRLVDQEFWQFEGVHCTETLSTPAAASIRMLLATSVAREG